MPADEHRPPSPTGSTPDDARFDVFLSHNSADKPAVEAIALRLRDEAKLNPFLDKWNLIPGEHFIPALERALERSNTVAIFFGSHGEGNWHREEKLLALVHGAEQRERRIIPVLLSAARSRPVKGFLRSRTWVDLANADGFERLLAGILGKEPGSLSVPPLPPHQPSPPSASAKKVYVCSTYLDDPTRCRTVERAIVDAGMAPVGLSHFTAAGRPTHEQRKTLIRDCDCLLGIVAHRYGPIPEGDSRSMMEIEYDEAVEYLKPRLMLTHASTTVDFETDFDEGPERWDKQAKLQAFREKIARDRAPGRFVDETLGTMVLEGLTELRARWVDDPPAGTGVTEAELRRYLDKIEASHREVQLAGFENAVRVKLELDELFVPLDAVIDHHGRGRDAFGAEDLTEKDGMDGRHGMREQIPLAEAFGCARELGHSGVVLLGDPGSG
ncbi:MAG: TIR domain-containing protein [Nannocystaceae bacterium]